MSSSACWGEADDAKLIALWRAPHNGADPTKLDQKSVKKLQKAQVSNQKALPKSASADCSSHLLSGDAALLVCAVQTSSHL